MLAKVLGLNTGPYIQWRKKLFIWSDWERVKDRDGEEKTKPKVWGTLNFAHANETERDSEWQQQQKQQTSISGSRFIFTTRDTL